MPNPNSYILFEVNGSPQKDLSATAVVRAIAKKYPKRKIIVTTMNPDMWLHNPHVFRVYKLGVTPYFFDDYIAGKDTLIFRHDPFSTEEYTYQRKHIVEIWCDLCNVPCDGVMPEIVLTQREYEIARNTLSKIAGNKKIVLLQTSDEHPNVNYTHAWRTTLHPTLAQQIVNELVVKDIAVIHFSKKGEPLLRNVSRPNLSTRQAIACIAHADASLFVDGLFQVAASALHEKAIVLWVGTKPVVWGYTTHHNIEATVSATMKKYIETHPAHITLSESNELATMTKELADCFDVKEIVDKLLN